LTTGFLVDITLDFHLTLKTIGACTVLQQSVEIQDEIQNEDWILESLLSGPHDSVVVHPHDDITNFFWNVF